jgi:hypothetical protein
VALSAALRLGAAVGAALRVNDSVPLARALETLPAAPSLGPAIRATSQLDHDVAFRWTLEALPAATSFRPAKRTSRQMSPYRQRPWLLQGESRTLNACFPEESPEDIVESRSSGVTTGSLIDPVFGHDITDWFSRSARFFADSYPLQLGSTGVHPPGPTTDIPHPEPFPRECSYSSRSNSSAFRWPRSVSGPPSDVASQFC